MIKDFDKRFVPMNVSFEQGKHKTTIRAYLVDARLLPINPEKNISLSIEIENKHLSDYQLVSKMVYRLTCRLYREAMQIMEKEKHKLILLS